MSDHRAGDVSSSASSKLLDVDDLHVSFKLERSVVYAVQGVSLSVEPGERVGVVGESGSGKSVTAMAILRMVADPGRITAGRIMFDGQDLMQRPLSQMHAVRGRQIGMVPQNPLSSLNPVLTVGDHFQEVLAVHLGLSGQAATARTVELLASVGMSDPVNRMREYPHRLSGGQRQRVMIALAMACEPRLLIADEPTTALDVTIQAQILKLIDGLVEDSNLGAVLITHNLGIVAGHCDRVLVMYAGRVMEAASVFDLFREPRHPYTAGLLTSVPRLTKRRTRRFNAIAGLPPQVTQIVNGCPFEPRCGQATDRCRTETPPLVEHGPGHVAACWNPLPEDELITR